MLKFFISALAVVGMLSVSNVAQADQSRYGAHDGYWSAAHSDHRGVHTKQMTLKRDIRRTVRKGDMPLRRLFGLHKSDFGGYRVDEVIVKLRGHDNRGQIRLMVNGKAVDSQNLRGERVVRLDVSNKAVIGRNLKSLRLAVKGKAAIKDIKVRMSMPAVATYKRNHHHNTSDQAFDQRTIERIARLILRQMQAAQY